MSSTLDIITLPNPSLRQPSRKVGLIDQQIKDLIQRMIDQSLAWEETRDHEIAVALAAVQIDELWRVVVVREDFDNSNNKNFIALINPEITKYAGKVSEVYQGCLSVKDYYVKVERHSIVKISALDINGQEVRFKAEGFLAEVMQHEIDHTKGITIVDRAVDSEDAFVTLGAKGRFERVDNEKLEESGILADD